MHWPATGDFEVEVAGCHMHKRAIERIAPHTTCFGYAYTFCTAQLVDEPDNKHDRDAVAVCIDGSRVGYLPRDMNAEFKVVRDAPTSKTAPTTCDAAIYGYIGADGVQRFNIELDLDLSPALLQVNRNFTPQFIKPVEVRSEPSVLTKSDSEAVLTVPHVRRDVWYSCREGLDLNPWEKPDESEQRLYVPGSGGGTGLVAVITKAADPQVYEILLYARAQVREIRGRQVLIRIGAGVDRRFAYLHSEVAAVVLLHLVQPLSREEPPRIVTLRCLVNMTERGKGTPSPGSQPQICEIVLDNEGIKLLTRILGACDVIGAFDASVVRKTLFVLMGDVVPSKPWSCARLESMRRKGATQCDTLLAMIAQAGVGTPDIVRATWQCESLAGILFSHRGKSKGTLTYMKGMLSRPL